MSRRITIMVRGGHEVVLQRVADEDAAGLVQHFVELFDQAEPTGSITAGDGTLIRHSEVVGVRNVSEQELSDRSRGRS